ncbi:MAG: acetyl-CoA decarbonylase/synthase complex subunit gamma [Chloroflexi bacterium]|nr:acetyl-CoA decarbonylase/synthase complex subunit gamma [Chloroflexota bacterium]MBU1749813.1 acetyl-CoA decarbonylase/synthase complex subunit gamma [Chloroflexota bacterium]MBU1878720.1 acetyl-CoA decarbonylase/synthase complex subunit gamma [Chloroflexota bacterium]
MGLSGLEIYKLLPKTNCKECGFPTCLAFAMKLSQKSVELAACPYVSEEAKEKLAASAAPPIRPVTVGADKKKITVGGETVLFRHDKTFFNPPGLVVRIPDTLPAAEITRLAQQVTGYSVERVGLDLSLDGFAVENASGDAAKFAAAVEAVHAVADWPLVLMSPNPQAMEAALPKAGTRPLIYAATADNWEALAGLAKKFKAPLAIKADNLDDLADLSEKVGNAGVQDIVLDPGARGLTDSLAALTQLRRLALKKSFRLLGFPIITFPGEGAVDADEEAILATEFIAKYGGIIVLDRFDPAVLYPLLTLRLNIYTDPQKPIQVSPGVYEIGAPKPESPLLVTTNFSLTYFSVAGEVEASGVPTWLLICDSEGMSVLTAWAAGKFDAEKIAKTVKQFGVADKISHKKIVLPGFVATISGELEEELPGWEIRVGPREAVDISGYLKNFWT